MRGIRDAEARFINTIELLKRYNQKIAISYSIYKDNIHTILQNIEYLSKLGIEHLNFGIINNIVEWNRYSNRYAISPPEVLDQLLDILPTLVTKKYPVDIYFAGFIHLYNKCYAYGIPEAKRYVEKTLLPRWICCETMRNSLYIAPSGQLIGCESLSGSSISRDFPNILQEPLNRILSSNSQFMAFIDQRLAKLLANNIKCKSCSFINICHGGCRGNAYSYRSFWEVDPIACTFFKEGYYDKIVDLMSLLKVPRISKI